MATLRGWFNYYTKDIPQEYLASASGGTTMTVPGQGSDLALIIQSIVKAPPLDPSTFDDPTGDRDPYEMIIRKEVEGLYPATGANLAEDIAARRKSENDKAGDRERTTTTTEKKDDGENKPE